MIVRRFLAYGVRVELRCETADAVQAEAVTSYLPPGWEDATCLGDGLRNENAINLRYDLGVDAVGAGPRIYRLRAGAECLTRSTSLPEVLRALSAHAEPLVARQSPDRLFVHAGTVVCCGTAIVLPGSSFAGKTTLVRAFLESGATYYSDEYAVLDRDGHVHPYPRPLAVRGSHLRPLQHLTAADLGAPIGVEPVPVGLIISTTYRHGALWRPQPLTPAQALLALMRHTVAARDDPRHSMPILKNTVAHATALAGPRGEAWHVVAGVIAQLSHSPRPMFASAREVSDELSEAVG